MTNNPDAESITAQTEPLSPALPTTWTQQNMLLQTQNQQTDVQQGTAQSEQAMLSDQFNFVDTNNFSDLSEQVAPRDQRTAVPTKPTKQQLLEAEIDQAFHEVFETDQTTPTEDNPHAAVFDEMADELYQTILQEQAKEEAAAGLTPTPNQAKAPDSSTQGWTNDSNIQYNMQEESSAAPIAQQEYLRQFWDETKQRFSAVKLLFDTQPYGSFQPAFAIGGSQSFYGNSNDAASRIRAYTDQPNNAIKQFVAQTESNRSIKQSSGSENLNNNFTQQNSQTDVAWTCHGYKHFSDKSKLWKDIVKSTKNGPAKYAQNIDDIQKFERDAWETGIPTVNGKNWKVKAYDEVIGATEGRETHYIRVENSANTIHGHPISQTEYFKLLKQR